MQLIVCCQLHTCYSRKQNIVAKVWILKPINYKAVKNWRKLNVTMCRCRTRRHVRHQTCLWCEVSMLRILKLHHFQYGLTMEKAESKRSMQIKTWMKLHTMEKAEYAKSDAPKLTPSNTKAKQFRGWVSATNWKEI